MKNHLLLLIALIAEPSVAREASLDVFAVATKPDFAVLASQPRRNAVAMQTADAIQARADARLSNADDDFHGVMHGLTIDRYAKRLDAPPWMRARASFPPGNVSFYLQSQADPICQSRSFFPRYGISNDAQARRATYFNLIVDVACDVGVPVVLFDGLLAQESRYRPFARSSAGAIGMAQLMPGTVQHLRIPDPWNVRQNLYGGAQYLHEQLHRFGTWELALAAYNAGPGQVDRYGGVPPFRETRNYVSTIMESIGSAHRVGAVSHTSNMARIPDPFRRVILVSFERRSAGSLR